MPLDRPVEGGLDEGGAPRFEDADCVIRQLQAFLRGRHLGLSLLGGLEIAEYKALFKNKGALVVRISEEDNVGFGPLWLDLLVRAAESEEG